MPSAAPLSSTVLPTPAAPDARAVVVIPARYHSTRLPGKPLVDIAGRPMIEHVYRRACSASRARATLVATDDHRVHAAVRTFGGDVILTRSDHRNGMERVAEVAANVTADCIVNLQGDEPLVDPRLIDLVLETLEADPDIALATLRTPLASAETAADPNVVKVVVDMRGFALYFSRAAIPHGSRATSRVYKHIGLYAYRREALLQIAACDPTPLERAERLEQLRALEHGYRIATAETEDDPVGVDTAEDLARVRKRLAAGAQG